MIKSHNLKEKKKNEEEDEMKEKEGSPPRDKPRFRLTEEKSHLTIISRKGENDDLKRILTILR